MKGQKYRTRNIRLFPTPRIFFYYISDRFGWLGWHKGYAVLTSVAVVGVAMLLMAVWFGVAVVFRRRSQFSLRSFLVLVAVVALPCRWMAVGDPGPLWYTIATPVAPFYARATGPRNQVAGQSRGHRRCFRAWIAGSPWILSNG